MIDHEESNRVVSASRQRGYNKRILIGNLEFLSRYQLVTRTDPSWSQIDGVCIAYSLKCNAVKWHIYQFKSNWQYEKLDSDKGEESRRTRADSFRMGSKTTWTMEKRSVKILEDQWLLPLTVGEGHGEAWNLVSSAEWIKLLCNRCSSVWITIEFYLWYTNIG